MKMMSLLKEDVSKYTNAGISKFAVAIASLTATRPDAVQKFVDTNELNIEKLYQFLKKSKLDGKMDFVTALVGKPNNPIQRKMIKMFSESVNEEQDHEVKMSQNSLDSIIKYATELKQKMGEMEKDIPAWIQDHITNAENYISQASSNYHEYSGVNENSINEMNPAVNKLVHKLLSKELNGLRVGGANHQYALMHILIGALRDANFSAAIKNVPKIFPKAKYEGDPMGEQDLEDMYEYEIGPKIASMAKWDGKDIVDAVGFYVSMTIGRPMGQKVEQLVEGKK
jgi:hypothetical protein